MGIEDDSDHSVDVENGEDGSAGTPDSEAIENVSDPTWLRMQYVLESGLDPEKPNQRVIAALRDLVASDYQPARLVFANAQYLYGEVKFVSALRFGLKGAYEDSLSEFDLSMIQALLRLAVARGELNLIVNPEFTEKYNDMSLKEIIQEVIDERKSLHLRNELLTALFARLLDDSA